MHLNVHACSLACAGSCIQHHCQEADPAVLRMALCGHVLSTASSLPATTKPWQPVPLPNFVTWWILPTWMIQNATWWKCIFLTQLDYLQDQPSWSKHLEFIPVYTQYININLWNDAGLIPAWGYYKQSCNKHFCVFTLTEISTVSGLMPKGRLWLVIWFLGA